MQLNIVISEELSADLKVMAKKYRTTVSEFARQTLQAAACVKSEKATVQLWDDPESHPHLEPIVECNVSLSNMPDGIWYGSLTLTNPDDIKKLFAPGPVRSFQTGFIKTESGSGGGICVNSHIYRLHNGDKQCSLTFVGCGSIQ